MAFDLNKIARLGPAALIESGDDAASGFSRGFNGDPDPRRRASANPTPDDWKPLVAETRAAQPERDEEARQILLAEMANYRGPEENRVAMYRDYAYRFGAEPTEDEIIAAGSRQDRNVADSQAQGIGAQGTTEPAAPRRGMDRVADRVDEIRRMRESFAAGQQKTEPMVPPDLVDRGNQPLSDVHGMLAEREQRERESAERGIVGDTGKTIVAGGLGMIGSVADLGYAVTGADLLNKIGQGIGGAVEVINQSMSPEMRDAAQRKFIADGNETADAWTDPRAYWHAVFNGLGSMIPMLPMGALAGAGVRSATGVNALRTGFTEATAAAAAQAEAAAVAGRMSQVAAKAAGERAGLAAGDAFLRQAGIEGGAAALAKREILANTVGMTAAGTVMTAGDAAGGAMQEVSAMPHEFLMAKSPEYRQTIKELIAAGVPQQQALAEAKQSIVRAAGREAGAIGAMLALPSNIVTGKIMERLLAGTLGAKTRLGNFGRAAGAQVPSETVEEGLTQFSSNVGVKDNANPDKDVMAGVGNAAVLGGIGALGMSAPHALRKPDSPLSNAVAATGGVPGAPAVPPGVVPPAAGGAGPAATPQPGAAAGPQADPELAAMVAAEQQDLAVRRDGMALAGQNRSRQDEIDAIYDVEARPFENLPDDVLVSTRGRVAKDVEKTVSKTGTMTAEQQVALRNLDYEINLRQGFQVQGGPEVARGGQQNGIEDPAGNAAIPAQGDQGRGADLPGSGNVGGVGSDAGDGAGGVAAAGSTAGGRPGLAPSDPGAAALAAARPWDQANRNRRGDVWFEGARANEAARAGFAEALVSGGDRLQSHGMGKEKTLGGGIANLLAMLSNGLDSRRGGGTLQTAPLVSRPGEGLVGATASGSAYSDGPFMLVARPGESLSGNLSGLGAVLINQAHADIAPQIAAAIRAIRPDIIVAPYSEAGSVTRKLSPPPTDEIDYGVERDGDGNVAVVARAWKDGPQIGRLQIPAAGITESGFGIGDIYVGAAARRKGVGSGMVDRAEQELGVPAAYSARQFNDEGEAFFRGRQAKREAARQKDSDELGKWFDDTLGEVAGEQQKPTEAAPADQPAPPPAKPSRSGKKGAFESSVKHSVDTEDSGVFDATVHRTKEGAVVIQHDDGLIEYNAEFAKGKTDEDLLRYSFEPVGFNKATAIEAPSIEKAPEPAASAPKAPAAPTSPREVAVTDIPPKALKRITVPVERMVGDQVQTVEVSAREALDDLDREISAYEKLLACVRSPA